MTAEEDLIYELDELQNKLKRREVLDNAKIFLLNKNIHVQYTRIFLVSELIIKFPQLFTDTSNDIIVIATKVFNNENLDINLPLLKIELDKLKETDLNELKNDLSNMEIRTRASSSETDDKNVTSCYKTQEKIINTAFNFFDKC